MKYVRFTTILPPKEVVLESPYDELPDELKPDLVPVRDIIRVNGQAVRMTIVEKDASEELKKQGK